MFNHLLTVFVCAADCGSFNKAAEKTLSVRTFCHETGKRIGKTAGHETVSPH